MSKKEEPEIGENASGADFTRVTFTPDLAKAVVINLAGHYEGPILWGTTRGPY